MKQIDLDDFFKNKLASKEYTMDESAWLLARDMIRADQKRKRRRVIIWMIVLLMGALGSFVFINGQQEGESILLVDNDSDIDVLSTQTKSIKEHKSKSPQLESKIEETNENPTVNHNSIDKKPTIGINTDAKYATKVFNTPMTSVKELDVITESKTYDNQIVTSPETIQEKIISNEIDAIIKLNTLRIGPLNHLKALPVFSISIIEVEDKKVFPQVISYWSSIDLGIGKESQHGSISLSLLKPIFTSLGIETGLHYHYVRAMDLPSHRGNLAIYNSFQKFFYQSSIEADQLHFVGTFVKLHWSMYKSHSLNVGAFGERLLLARGTIRKDPEGAHSAWIVETGLNRNHFGTDLGYTYSINNRLKLSVAARWDLTDVFSEGIPFSKNISHIVVGSSFSF